MEDEEKRRPNKDSIAAYKQSLEAKSGKSKEDNTEGSDEESEKLEEDEEDEDFDVLDIEDDKNGEDLDTDTDMDEEDAKGLEKEIDTDGDEDDNRNETVNTRISATNSLKAPVYHPGGVQSKKIHAVTFRLLSLLIAYTHFSFSEERRLGRLGSH
jgi:hypothetical protein